jgi:hydrogenase maturation protease
MRERKDTIVGGLGNPLMTDEGIGLHIVRELIGRGDQHGNVDFAELGTSLMSMVHAIAGRRKAILIDCAYMGEAPGTIRQFTPDEVVSTRWLTHFSLHEGDLLSALELSRRLGEYPEQVVVFGIEPEKLGPGERLSSTLEKRLHNYVDTIMQEITGD